MIRLFCILIAIFSFGNAVAATSCSGRVNAIYKWSHETTISIQIIMNNGTVTNWIGMPTKSDEAIALMALTTGKPIDVYWHAADVNGCANGWAHNRLLDGFILVKYQYYSG